MKADFSRDTFMPHKHFLRVLAQQGRVQLDADLNEQTAILLHYLQGLAADVIGPYGGPAHNLGFAIIGSVEEIKKLPNLSEKERSQLINDFESAKHELLIGAGHYYIDGVLCENDVPLFLEHQSHFKGIGLTQLAT